MKTFIAYVSYYNDAYRANGGGKSASCTVDDIKAVEALAKKVFGSEVKPTITLLETVNTNKKRFEVKDGAP